MMINIKVIPDMKKEVGIHISYRVLIKDILQKVESNQYAVADKSLDSKVSIKYYLIP